MANKPEAVALSPESLVGIEAFRSLTAGDRQQIIELCQARRYEANQQIFSRQDESRDVFFIISGTVRVTVYSVTGKEVTFQDLGAGQMFGELSAIDGSPRSAHVMALTESLLASMSPEGFWKVVRDYPAVAEITLKRLTGMIRLLSERVFEVSALPVKDRIHAELLRMAREVDSAGKEVVISPAPTHSDIANRIGTHREAITRELTELKRSGLLTRRDGKLILHDVAQLEQMVGAVLGAGG